MSEKLNEVVSISNSINELEKDLTSLRNKRRKLMIELREEKVTARKLSDLLGMSEQNVHKIVKGK